MGEDSQVRLGIVVADPLRGLGLQSILEQDARYDPMVCDLGTALAQESMALVLMDDRLEGEVIVDVLVRMRQERPDLKCIVIGEAPDFSFIQEVIRAGAHGYLLETTSEVEVGSAVQAVLAGSVWAPRRVLARLLNDSTGQAEDFAEQLTVLTVLTARERQVLELLMNGCSNREIGSKLGIDEVTVKAHLGRMLRKTGSKNRVELTLRALDQQAAARAEVAQQS